MQRFDIHGRQELCGSAQDRADIYEHWLSFIARNTYSCKLQKKIPLEAGFEVRARSRDIDGFTLARFISRTAHSYKLVRDAAQILADRQDRYVLFMELSGDVEIRQFDRSQALGADSFVFMVASEPVTFVSNTAGAKDTIVLLMPRDYVDGRTVEGERLCMRTNDRRESLNGLVVDTFKAFEKHAWNIADREFQKSARIVADLALLSLSGAADAASNESSIRAGNLARAKRIMHRRLADAELTLADVARECGLSLSYLHKLFRDEHLTMERYLKDCRLQRARELLERSSERSVSVTEISMECGFSSPSYFSTEFKRAFGISPREAQRLKGP